MLKRLVLVACMTLLMVSDSLPRSQFFFDDTPGDDSAVVDGSEFVFARLLYGSGLANFGFYGRGETWRTDWPEADSHFMLGVDRLTNIRIVLDDFVTVPIMDDALFDYPLLYAVEVGYMELSQPEADRLREYMERGGFMIVDDFWGTREWANFNRQLQKIFPDREVEDLPLTHEVFHSFYDIDEIIQVPVYTSGCYGRATWEQDGYNPYAFAIFDDNRRPMLMINHNTDLGDAWEWADLPCYPHYYSGYAYRLGINAIVYSMTH